MMLGAMICELRSGIPVCNGCPGESVLWKFCCGDMRQVGMVLACIVIFKSMKDAPGKQSLAQLKSVFTSFQTYNQDWIGWGVC